MEDTNGKTSQGRDSQESTNQNDRGRLGKIGGESGKFGFSGAGRARPSHRPWTGCSGREPESDRAGGIGSRLIAKLIEQRGEVLGRYQIVCDRKAEYEAKLEQIDRELAEARKLLAEAIDLTY